MSQKHYTILKLGFLYEMNCTQGKDFFFRAFDVKYYYHQIIVTSFGAWRSFQIQMKYTKTPFRSQDTLCSLVSHFQWGHQVSTYPGKRGEACQSLSLSSVQYALIFKEGLDSTTVLWPCRCLQCYYSFWRVSHEKWCWMCCIGRLSASSRLTSL